MCGSPIHVLCTPWMFLCLFAARCHPPTSPGCWRLLPLPLSPFGMLNQDRPWGGTVASADTVPGGELGDCSLAGSPTEAVWGERTGARRRSSRSAPTSMRGVETEQLLTAFRLHLPHGADASCFPRAVLHAGPALSHTKIMCIFFCHLAPAMDLLGGLDSCPLWRPGGCWQVQCLRSCS